LVYSTSGCCYSGVPALSVISWFILHLVAAILVFLLCLLFPLSLMLKYFGASCLDFTYFEKPNLYTKSERLAVSPKTPWAWSEKDDLYNRQIVILL
jgi:hypothetical protein